MTVEGPVVVRNCVRGPSGWGRATPARHLVRVLAAEHLEPEAWRHEARWGTLGDQRLWRRVARAMGRESWVTDVHDVHVRALLWERADLVVGRGQVVAIGSGPEADQLVDRFRALG